MKRVNQWATTMINDMSALEKAFITGTTVKLFNPDGTKTQGEDGFFKYIWLPVKVYDEQNEEMSEYHYYNIGLQYSEIVDLYQTQYGFNYLASPLHNENIGQILIDSQELAKKILIIFKKNLGKYYKMLELQGYTYNPLWNVDGTEIRQSLENQGINDVETKSFSSGRDATANNNKTEHQTTPYDDDTYKNEYKDTTQGQSTVSNFPQYEWNGTDWVVSKDSMSNVGSESITKEGGRTSTAYTHKNAKNGVTGHEDYTVDAKDTAFGEQLIGGDKMYNEKYIRQGNIGVTKTQELIESERENLRFSLIQEFFDDINSQILVGIY